MPGARRLAPGLGPQQCTHRVLDPGLRLLDACDGEGGEFRVLGRFNPRAALWPSHPTPEQSEQPCPVSPSTPVLAHLCSAACGSR